MCGSMAEIQSATAEIRRGKKKKNNNSNNKLQDKNIMTASATQGGHSKLGNARIYYKFSHIPGLQDQVHPSDQPENL